MSTVQSIFNRNHFCFHLTVLCMFVVKKCLCMNRSFYNLERNNIYVVSRGAPIKSSQVNFYCRILPVNMTYYLQLK